ncbi:hypothetical protein [Streptomyces sp. B6B3]|uniref:hypothetical protein n=1 Tax=Streptomyces sp. B6B3 TaxID=3153570 RepID=UPI00325F2D2F
MPEVKGLREVWDAPEVGEVREAGDVPDVPEAGDVPDVRHVPEVKGLREARDVPDVERELVGVREAIARGVAHDGRYGSGAVVAEAVRVWRAGERRLAAVPARARREYGAVVAEAAEVAGWLLFDADRQAASRRASLASLALARAVGDRPMEWFALTNLALQDVELGRPQEALRIADEVLTGLRVPPRVALLARARRGRALALAGEAGRALVDLRAARSATGESLTARDPAWTWWVRAPELRGQEGDALLALGRPEAAADAARAALAEVSGRNVLYYEVALLAAHVRVGAWRDAEAVLHRVAPLLRDVPSRRNHRRLRRTCAALVRDPRAPRWLAALARDVHGLAR